MSVSVACPACTAVSRFDGTPTVCPQCGAAYPEALRKSVDTSLHAAPPRPRRPALLLFGMSFSILAAFGVAVLTLMAVTDTGTFKINEEQVSGPEFLRRAGAYMLIAELLFASIAYGLLRERAWVRPLMILFWLLPIITSVGIGTGNIGCLLACSTLLAAAGAIPAWYYLYRYPDVAAYFESLKVTNTLPR